MDTQPHGNFIAFINRSKQPGDNQPMFDGRIAIPGEEASTALPSGHMSTRTRPPARCRSCTTARSTLSPHAAPKG
jgi:hypothetical protein